MAAYNERCEIHNPLQRNTKVSTYRGCTNVSAELSHYHPLQFDWSRLVVFLQPPLQILRNFASYFRPSTSCTGVCLAITMLQYYICVGIMLTVVLVLGLGLGFGIISYFVIGTWSNGRFSRSVLRESRLAGPAPNEISSDELYHEWYFVPPRTKLWQWQRR